MDNWKLGIFFLDRAPTVSSERIGMGRSAQTLLVDFQP